MRIVTNSYETVENEDGSYTTTEVYTTTPSTKKEQAAAWAGLGAIVALPVIVAVAPEIAIALRERRARRKAEKLAKKNEK